MTKDGESVNSGSATTTAQSPGARTRGALLDSRRLAVALAGLALAYALVINVRTVVDTDIGWQLTAGRYVVQHGRIPFRDVFSYTAEGREWAYPALSGVIFYGAHQVGGFALLTLLGVAACALTVGLLLRGAGPAQAALAIVAVPMIGYGTLPGRTCSPRRC